MSFAKWELQTVSNRLMNMYQGNSLAELREHVFSLTQLCYTIVHGLSMRPPEGAVRVACT